ncbi:MAG: PRC and DUF2382 domain-containing protein [Thermoleophilia bacterium]|nr:PRC and DUF2382 domain-containing protein [Thermoleophilia bacterium]
MSNHTLAAIEAARGNPVYASDGEKIGSVEEIFYDEQTNQAEWVGIGTGFFGTKRVLVPTAHADLRDDGLYVPYDKQHVQDSPDVDSDEIDESLERELYAYYGLQASTQRSETVLPEGDLDRGVSAPDSPGDTTDGSMVTRSEEELQVGTREQEAGRARLRKWVETEPVQMDVDLQRETARVTRERVDQPVSDAEIGEEEIEVELREEQPVVQKQAVAKERVGLEKDVETERQTVTDEVRKERVDVDGDAA